MSKFINRLPLTEDACTSAVHIQLTRPRSHAISDDELAHILPWCPNLESIDLSGVPDLTDRTVILLAHSAPDLREIDLSGCKLVTDAAIIELAHVCSDLEIVKLNRLSTLTDQAISTLARQLVNLAELELCDLHLITAVSVRDIWTFCTKVRRLKLARCTGLTDKAFPAVPFRTEAKRRSRLRGSWPATVSERSSSPITERTASTAARAPRPPSTVLSDSSASDSEGSEGARPMSWLETLPPLLFSPGRKFANLRTLDVSWCPLLTDAAIAGTVAYAPRLYHVNLSGCPLLTDAAASAIAQLEYHLDQVGLSFLGNLTDRGVATIVKACDQLRIVDVSYCPHLTDLSLLELATLPLQRLSLSGVPQLTDNALLFLAERAGTLMRLELDRCRHISLSAIHVLLRRAPNLSHLNVTAVSSMRRVGVERFSDRAPKNWDERAQGIYRVYRYEGVQKLLGFLDKEYQRHCEAERRNIPFVPRADDSNDLY
ncbi:RNI-like protein [Wolfiporia cocos MD-104 SS10]|uniref:RNI-like protein n=1 Tax=Wolfiporia cocos (strain MD-104) TaxID=742152 RepID=A0A2H3JLR9_WOLCO|nr:RNI-like protein [Wolfiporia cocos MD-104 SS10]